MYYEQFLSSHEDMQKDALRKGVVSRIYNLILEKETEIEGLKSIWERDLKREIKIGLEKKLEDDSFMELERKCCCGG